MNLKVLILVFLLFSTVAEAQSISKRKFTRANKPVFLIDGFANFSAASANQSSSFESNNLSNEINNNSVHNAQLIGNDSQIFLKTGIITENKTIYGAIAKVEFNFNSEGRNENPNLDQSFLFAKNSFGKIELGNNQAVNQKMKAGPAKFARAAGGINGKYLENVNLPISSNSSSNVKVPQFILLAQSPMGHGGYARSAYRNEVSANQNDYNSFNRSNFRVLKDNSFDGVEDATKISYYSLRIHGFKIGASYTPNSSDGGVTSSQYYNSEDASVRNILSLGLNYLEDFDNLAVEISATAEKGKTKNSTSISGIQRSNLASYDLGITLSYFGFDLGASYGSWKDSLQAKSGIYSCDYDSSLTLSSQDCSSSSSDFSDPSYYSLGVGYSFGPIAASITHLKSQFQKNNYQALSLGLDYKLTRDLMPYIEITKFGFKSNQPQASDLTGSSGAIKDNNGYVLLTGILISF